MMSSGSLEVSKFVRLSVHPFVKWLNTGKDGVVGYTKVRTHKWFVIQACFTAASNFVESIFLRKEAGRQQGI